MKRAAWTIAAAGCIDALCGDPAWLPHPVRLMGAAIAAGERRLNAGGRGSRAAGAGFSLALVGLSAAAGAVAQRFAPARIILGASTIAARDLLSEAGAVAAALETADIGLARRRVARIVGRDTAELDAAEIARATIETLAESACDGIVAPLFWFALGGLPGALGFKAASTLDSMIGHREPRFRTFGAFAARLDDALNFVPARITAALLAVCAAAPGRAVRVALRDAQGHASPNAGWSEAALAGALDVRLGGANSYGGVRSEGALFNAGARVPGTPDVRRAMRIVGRAAVLACILATGARA